MLVSQIREAPYIPEPNSGTNGGQEERPAARPLGSVPGPQLDTLGYQGPIPGFGI